MIIPNTTGAKLLSYCLETDDPLELSPLWLPIIAWRIIESPYSGESPNLIAEPITVEILPEHWCIANPSLNNFVFPENSSCETLEDAMATFKSTLAHQRRKATAS